MAFQTITLNMIPHGDMPVFYASQYETGRPIIIDIVMGEDSFNCESLYVELHCRKVDDTVIVLLPDSIDGYTVTFIGTEQLLACPGKNLCEVCLYVDETKDTSLGSLNFFIEVEPDPMSGGITSESEIANLTTQIEQITEQVLSEDYYDKTEVDALLEDKADVTDLPDMSLYYTKTQTDGLLDDKADKSDTYTKAQVDSALAAKANSADLATVATTGDYDDLLNKPTIPAAQIQSDWDQADNTKVDYIKNKPDLDDYLTVSQYNDDMSGLNDALNEAFNDVQKEIILDTGTENESPYQIRTAPSSIGNLALEKIVGLTVCFNQLIPDASTHQTGTGTGNWQLLDQRFSLINNHVYLCLISGTFDNDTLFRFRDIPADIATDSVNGSFIYKSTTDTNNTTGLQPKITNGASYDYYYNVIDLTAMFNPEVADYLYNLENG